MLVFLSTNQEQTKNRLQSTFSRAWHPLFISPRLKLVARFCFEFWLVHGVIGVCCAYHGSGFSAALQNLSMSRSVNLTRICNISKKCNCYLQTDLTLVSEAWRSRKYCHTPDWHIEQFTSTHLNYRVKNSATRWDCLSHENNTLTPPSARTWSAQSGVKQAGATSFP